MRTGWQWKHGAFESEVYPTKEGALFWAVRATTGGSDDDIAVREVVLGEWQAVDYRGLVSEQQMSAGLLERDAAIARAGAQARAEKLAKQHNAHSNGEPKPGLLGTDSYDEMYEGSCSMFAQHLVADHGYPAEVVEPYQTGPDQSAWSELYRLHSAARRRGEKK